MKMMIFHFPYFHILHTLKKFLPRKLETCTVLYWATWVCKESQPLEIANILKLIYGTTTLWCFILQVHYYAPVSTILISNTQGLYWTIILNLVSQSYLHTVKPYLNSDLRFVCEFSETDKSKPTARISQDFTLQSKMSPMRMK